MSERPRTATLAALAALLGLESLAVLASAIFLAVELAGGGAASAASTIALIVLLALVAVLVGVVAWSTWRQRAWIRGAAFTWQVLQIAAGWVFLQGDLAPAVGWLLVGAGVIGAALALAPSTRRSLAGRGEADAPFLEPTVSSAPDGGRAARAK